MCCVLLPIMIDGVTSTPVSTKCEERGCVVVALNFRFCWSLCRDQTSPNHLRTRAPHAFPHSTPACLPGTRHHPATWCLLDLLDSLTVEWREVLLAVRDTPNATALFREAFDVLKRTDDENKGDTGADTAKQKRQLQMYLLEALELKLLVRRDMERIEEDIATGARTVRAQLR
jgi:hypothetical protein